YCQVEGAGPGACAPGCRTAPDNCPRGFDCQPEQRQCVNDCQCEPGAVTGCDGDALRVCSGDCYRFERRGCPEGQVCRQAECVNRPAPDAAPPAPDMAPAMDMAAADMAPADMLPADMAPADMTPADMMPADMMPVDMAPADMMPVDMASPDAGPAAQ
ncbi:MAG: hypothetical protein KC620_17260, partial [Myxococcales bacterium]|nr:hypothetical protein [Myxococcales bacterium]